MKHFLLSVLFILIITGLARGQEKSISDALTEVKAPTSPASVIIGNQPSVISRPKSWNELEASVYSNFLNNNQPAIPNDFALEFSPYWASNKRYLSLEEYMDNKNISKSLLQNLAFSVSSTQKFIINDSVNTNALGFGLRTLIWQGNKNKIQTLIIKQRVGQWIGTQSEKLSDKIQAQLNTDNSLSNDDYADKYIQALIAGLHTLFKDKRVESSVIEAFFDNLEEDLQNLDLQNVSRNDYDSKIKEVIDKHDDIKVTTSSLQQLRKDREGFRLEFAAAASLNFPTNEMGFSYVPKVGFWITPSYQLPDNDRVEFLGVFRYFHFYNGFYNKYIPNTATMDNVVDYGLRLVYKWSKLSLECEAIWKNSKSIVSQTTDSTTQLTTTVSKEENDFQWIANFNYKINEKVVLSYNFGKQFNPVFKLNGNVVSLLTLNYGIGAPKKSDIK
jgi:hypothetical protein